MRNDFFHNSCKVKYVANFCKLNEDNAIFKRFFQSIYSEKYMINLNLLFFGLFEILYLSVNRCVNDVEYIHGSTQKV